MNDCRKLTSGGLAWVPVLLLVAVGIFGFAVPSTLMAQTTAMISGTVQDQTGGVIPNAAVTLTNIATGDARTVQSNESGVYAFPSLVPAIYNIEAKAKGFKAKIVTGIELHAGESRTVPALSLEVGTESETVTVSATSEMIPVENGQRNVVLSTADLAKIPIVGRDTTELIRVLPGATTMSAGGGLTDNSPMFNAQVVHVQNSSVGMGMNISGAIYRGGTSLLSDGANIIDVGNMGASLSVVNPNMTSEVSVQASNFGADVPFGPVVISTISKSGSSDYHGEAYFNARNSVLNANDWRSNHQGIPLGPQHYYYPGGSFGGPVPGTHKKLMFWGGYERWLQNQGNANVLTSSIPTAAMMSGNFSMDDPENAKLCPHGFFQGNPPGGVGAGPWCSDLGGTVLANGTTTAALPTPAATGQYTAGGKTYITDNGQKFPAGFLDPGSAALAKIWPKANANPATTPGGYNYYQPIENVDNGWIYRVRIDYLLGENTKIYGSYQQAFDSGLAQGNGAHLYWTPGNAIPFPGGGVTQRFYGKSMAGHIVHNFNPTTTNDFMAAWAFGSFPFTTPKPSAAYKSTLGYNYGSVFGTKALNIPAYSSAGNQTFPDFSQASIFENPPGQYGVRKEAPQFGDTLTKVWGRHTIKLGAFTQTTDNWQSNMGSYMDGNLRFDAGQQPDLVNAGNGVIGSPFNATANFVSGIASNYGENNSAPIADLAYMSTAAFVDDTWKVTNRLSVELGIRMEHVGHWYDRNRLGMPVFYKDRVMQDLYAGKYAPGFYWHAIDAGVPLSGQPNRFVYPNPRFGMAYDVFGNGNTVVRGGWGSYRFITQTNTPGGALPTSQHMLGYNLPGASRIQLQNLGSLKYTTCPSATQKPPCGVSGSLTGLDPTDPGQPMTQAYNLTIDQRLPWNSLFEIAYVGSQTSQLSTNGQDNQGSNFSELANQNKTPLGAFFQPDPVTGITSTNPENLGQQLDGTLIPNKRADYHPLGLAYGTNGVYMNQNIAYSNYNGLQASWTKNTGHLTFNLNTTWSKALGTGMQSNPYDINLNYGPLNIDRPWVFNSVYTYDSGTVHTGSRVVNQVLGGWIVNGISTWQAGGYIPTALGNQVPNFNMGLQYTNLPSDAAARGITTNLGVPTYFGIDAPPPGTSGLAIMPVLTCNPNSGRAGNQLVNGKCFMAPAVGTQGGQKWPYMRAMAYFDNDLAIARTFTLRENHRVQIRASAFNWMNHPLPQFSSLTPLTLNYNVDYAGKTITPNYNTSSTGANAFGVTDTKSRAPYQRIIELDVKYSF